MRSCSIGPPKDFRAPFKGVLSLWTEQSKSPSRPDDHSTIIPTLRFAQRIPASSRTGVHVVGWKSSRLLRISSAAAVIGALLLALSGCGEETYKVSRGTDELPKPQIKNAKAAARIEKAQQIEDQIFQKGKKLR
jgi:hypothetical protein